VYGNCLQFNTGVNSSIRMTNIEGPLNGLTLSLTIPKNNNPYPNLEGRGLKLFIHNRTFAPRINDVINIKAGFTTNVAIEKTFSFKAPYPYSECHDLSKFSSEYYNTLKTANKTYSQYDCTKLCLQKLIKEKCDCYWTRYINLDESIPPCLNLTQLDCIFEQQNEIEFDESCLEQCPLECESVTYVAQLSSLDYPSSTLYTYLANNSEYLKSFLSSTGKNFSTDTAASYLVSINIFFPFTEYKEISLEPKLHLFELVSQIGGSMEMLVGFSMFHLIRFIEIHFLILLTLIKN